MYKKNNNTLILIWLLLSIFVFPSCSKKDKIVIKEDPILKSFIAMVNRAVEGDSETNSKLSNLIDINKPILKPQKKIIDTIRLNYDLYYYVLLQYSNPEYNRFAIYNKNFNLYLLDKSLNGEIDVQRIIKDNKVFIGIQENYLSKNVFVLQRYSLYTDFKNYISLVFRTFLSLTHPYGSIKQVITNFSRDTIYTEILPSKELLENGFNKNDRYNYFVFDYAKMKYVSNSDIMQKWVLKEISNPKNFNILNNK